MTSESNHFPAFDYLSDKVIWFKASASFNAITAELVRLPTHRPSAIALNWPFTFYSFASDLKRAGSKTNPEV